MVFLLASLLPEQAEKRGFCSVAFSLLGQSTSEVIGERVRSERPRASAFKPRLTHLYLSEA